MTGVQRKEKRGRGKVCEIRLSLLIVATVACLLLSGCKETPRQALGTLEWDRLSSRIPASEVITEILVQEGQRVVEGELLLKIDDRKITARLDELEAQKKQTSWQLQELIAGPRPQTIAGARASLDAARATLDNNREIYERQKKLFASKVVSQESLDTLRSRYLSSQETVNGLSETLAELLAGSRPEQIEQTRAQLEVLSAQQKQLELIREDYSVFATRAGLVDSIPFKKGDRPPANAVVCVLLAGEQPWARVAIPAPLRSQLKVGEKYHIQVDGYPQPFAARLRRLSAEAAFTPF